MARTPTQNVRSLHWIVRGCQLIWKSAKFVVGTIVLNLLVAVLVTLSFTVPSSFSSLPVLTWVIQNHVIIIIIFAVIISLSVLSFIGSKLPPTVFAQKVKRIYLRHMISKKQTLVLEGIPSSLMSQSVPLDEVFIPVQFHPYRALIDYPLTENELNTYLALAQQNILDPEMERVFLEAERTWQYPYEANEKIGIAAFWQRLTKDNPAAVIQGFLGMGKSTLLARLTLHMARRCLGESDALLPTSNQVPLIPIILSLKDYSQERSNSQPSSTSPLSLSDYLKIALNKLDFLEEWDIDNLEAILRKALKHGRCLIMFDGLDEEIEHNKRLQIQDAIKEFILRWRTSSQKSTSFNRFLITSRMAGYDQTAFPDPDYTHCTIASLVPEQIKDFLPRWFRAIVRHDRGLGNANIDEQTLADISQDANARAEVLKRAISLHKGVQALAENPLLLTLLAAMMRGGKFSTIRVELYQTVTRTMLESRNERIGLTAIEEATAIQRLGPLAYRIHEQDTYFALESEVMDSLRRTIISKEGGTQEEVEKEARNFLKSVRERGGIFVQRTEHYYGFFHPCFQQYYVARYLLDEIKKDLNKNIPKLIKRVRLSDKLWREPFVLAVTYQSNADYLVAGRIIQILLVPPPDATDESKVHDLLLAAECLIEANKSLANSQLKEQVALQLLQTYQLSLQRQDAQTCSKIETVMLSWLQSLPSGTYRYSYMLVVLVVLCKAIKGGEQTVEQRSVLRLLSHIAEQLVSCPPIILEELIPLLLAQADLPAVGEYQPANNLSVLTDQELQQLSVVASSGLILANHHKLCQAIQEQMNHISVSSANEIRFVLRIAEGISDGQVRGAALLALKRATPQTADATRVLESGKQSQISVVCAAVEERIAAISSANATI